MWESVVKINKFVQNKWNDEFSEKKIKTLSNSLTTTTTTTNDRGKQVKNKNIIIITPNIMRTNIVKKTKRKLTPAFFCCSIQLTAVDGHLGHLGHQAKGKKVCVYSCLLC